MSHLNIPRVNLTLQREPKVDYVPIKVEDPASVIKLLDFLKYKPEEMFISLHLNTLNEIINVHEVAHGTLNESLIHPREVFKYALMNNAKSVIFAHNHPAGSMVPSWEDMQTTVTLVKAGELMGVPVLDHLIVGPNDLYYSFRSSREDIWSTVLK